MTEEEQLLPEPRIILSSEELNNDYKIRLQAMIIVKLGLADVQKKATGEGALKIGADIVLDQVWKNKAEIEGSPGHYQND